MVVEPLPIFLYDAYLFERNAYYRHTNVLLFRACEVAFKLDVPGFFKVFIQFRPPLEDGASSAP